MAQSIRVSDRLYEAAVSRSQAMTRSIAQQIEHWAMIGMAAELEQSGTQQTSAMLTAMHKLDESMVRSGTKKSAELHFVSPRLARSARVNLKDVSF